LNDDTFEQSDLNDNNRDPLGIIGWQIGGKYKVTKHIGGGGFGEVYEGFNINLPEQRLVIKFFKRVQSRDKFAKEAKILCLLDHPHICRVIDFLPEEGALVVPFIDGKDGAQVLRESGPLGEADFLRLARDLTGALEFAHSQRVAHRDIKPGNILIDKNGHIYLIDFGIAKEVGEAATRTAYQALTPQFAAPERQTGDAKYDPFLSDVYELGVTLFNFVTNSMPYRNPANPSIREWGGMSVEGLSNDLIKILKRATHPDPQMRYASVKALHQDLMELRTVYAKPTKAKWLVPVIAVAVLGVVGFFAKDKIIELFNRPAEISTTKEAVAPAKSDITAPDTSVIAAEIKKEATPPKPAVKPVDVAAKVEEPKPRVEPTPPPRPVFKALIAPGENAVLRVDGLIKPQNEYVITSRGQHDFEVTHRDYPIYRKRVNLTEDTNIVTLNLDDAFAETALLDFQLALFPSADDKTLEFSLNGRPRNFTSFPAFGLKRAAGEWEVGVSLYPTGAKTNAHKIDSCVTFPYGGGPHLVIKGASGKMDFARIAKEGGTSVPLIIFWSEK
jgi:predicted Ser/Thr protein kinase